MFLTLILRVCGIFVTLWVDTHFMNFELIDVLYAVASISLVVLTVATVKVLLKVTETLRKLDLVLDDVRNTTGEMRYLKEKAKGTFFSTASVILGLLFGKRS